jgi:predicted MFS family arabinose efflux permease
MLGTLFTGAREATAQGIRVSFDSVVSAVAPVTAGVLFLFGWQLPFLVYFLVVPLAVWFWFVILDLEIDSDRATRQYISELLAVLKRPVMAFLMISFFFRHTLLYGLYTYVSVLATREAGMAVVMVGVLLGTRAVLKTISSMQAGRFAGRYSPVGVAFFGFVLLGGGVFLMGAFPTVSMLFVGIMLLGFGDGLLSPTQKSLVNELTPPEFRNSVMSAGFTFVNIGKTGGPILVGLGLGVLGPAFSFVVLGVIGGGIGSALLGGIWYLERDG